MDRVISCADAVQRLWGFLDDELDDHDHQLIEDHLAFCVRCCGELELARHLRRLLGTKSGGDLPLEVLARLDEFIEGLPDEPSTTGTT